MSRSTPRLAPLAGIFGILGVVTGLALDNFPDGSYSDAQVAAWFAENGTTRWVLSGACIALGGSLLLVFASVAAARVERLTGPGITPVARQLITVGGSAWAVLTMIGGAMWLSSPIGVLMFEAKPSAGLMLGAGAAYATLVTVCAFAAAALAAALTTVSRHTGLLGPWVTRLGYPAAVLMLTNVVLPMAVITLWFTAASISLVRRDRDRSRASVPTPDLATA